MSDRTIFILTIIPCGIFALLGLATLVVYGSEAVSGVVANFMLSAIFGSIAYVKYKKYNGSGTKNK